MNVNKCDGDCFHCPLPDCEQDGYIASDREMLEHVAALLSPRQNPGRGQLKRKYNASKRKANMRKIICPETGEIYANAVEATRASSLNMTSSMYRTLREGNATKDGRHYMYLDEWEKKQCQESK